MSYRFNQTLTMTLDVRREWHRAINRIPDGEHCELDISPRRVINRSTDANRWYFRNVVTPLAVFLMDQEIELGTLERAKDYAHYNEIVPNILGYDERRLGNGRTVRIPKPTHTMEPAEFSKFVDRAEAWVVKYIGGDDEHAADASRATATVGGRR